MTWGRVLGAIAAVLVSFAVAPAEPAQAAVGSCTPWQVGDVVAGLGALENLAFDGRGGLLLSETSQAGPGALVRLGTDGSRDVLVPDVNGAGGIVVDGSRAWFTTGNTLLAGVLAVPNGTIDEVDLDTGKRTTVARDLIVPTGLARLANGELLTTAKPGLTRVPVAGTPEQVRRAAGVANGIAVDPGRGRIYVDNRVDPANQLLVLDERNPAAEPRAITLPGTGPMNAADDLTVGPDGQVYVPLFAAGKVLRVDPDSGTACEIASGLSYPSAVEFGSGPGWDPNALYATSYDGTVRKLTP